MKSSRTISVIDSSNGTIDKCAITSYEVLPNYGSLFLVDHPKVGTLSVILADGVQFTLSDWQGEQCTNLLGAGSFHWVDALGNGAVIIDGLPRLSDFYC